MADVDWLIASLISSDGFRGGGYVRMNKSLKRKLFLLIVRIMFKLRLLENKYR
ncbi:MAG: hypothetical protein QXT14_03095 [Candidatus Bathyarchaeia archaeon]